MKKLFILFLLIQNFLTTNAENEKKNLFATSLNQDINAKIKGTVIDGTDGKTPVEFATVALYSKATNKVIDGATTDEKGNFSINNIINGTYKIVISFVG